MAKDRITLTRNVLLSFFCILLFTNHVFGNPECDEQMKDLGKLAKLTATSWPREERKLKFSLNTGIANQKVQLATSFSNWEEALFDLQEVAPGHYTMELPAPWTNAIEYKFVVNGKWQADPENPEQSADGFGGVNSVARIDFKSDPLLENSPVIPWKQTDFALKDENGNDRKIWVLSPPRPATKKQVILYFQDGGDLLNRTHLDNWVANISAQPDMPSIIAVLIPPIDRMNEYNMSDDYVRFLTKTVVPTVEKSLGGGFKADARGVVGESLGGLIAFYAGMTAQDVFGIIVSQSGSFWYQDLAILKKMIPSTHPEQKIYLSAGIFESREKMLNGNHKTVTRAKVLGYSIIYEEFPTKHDWFYWTNELTRIAEVLFTPKNSDIKTAPLH